MRFAPTPLGPQHTTQDLGNSGRPFASPRTPKPSIDGVGSADAHPSLGTTAPWLECLPLLILPRARVSPHLHFYTFTTEQTIGQRERVRKRDKFEGSDRQLDGPGESTRQKTRQIRTIHIDPTTMNTTISQSEGTTTHTYQYESHETQWCGTNRRNAPGTSCGRETKAARPKARVSRWQNDQQAIRGCPNRGTPLRGPPAAHSYLPPHRESRSEVGTGSSHCQHLQYMRRRWIAEATETKMASREIMTRDWRQTAEAWLD